MKLIDNNKIKQEIKIILCVSRDKNIKIIPKNNLFLKIKVMAIRKREIDIDCLM